MKGKKMKLILKTLLFLITGKQIGTLSLFTTNITSKATQETNNNIYKNS